MECESERKWFARGSRRRPRAKPSCPASRSPGLTAPFAEDKFDGEFLTDERVRGVLEGLGASLVEMLRKTHGGPDTALAA